MRGEITGRDVVVHAVTIMRLWGMRAYAKCLGAVIRNEPTTFLETVCVAPCAARRPPRGRVHRRG